MEKLTPIYRLRWRNCHLLMKTMMARGLVLLCLISKIMSILVCGYQMGKSSIFAMTTHWIWASVRIRRRGNLSFKRQPSIRSPVKNIS